MKKGYKPKWGERHTKIVEDYKRKKLSGKQTYYTFEDPDDFIAHLHGKTFEQFRNAGYTLIEGKDEYGNKTILVKRAGS